MILSRVAVKDGEVAPDGFAISGLKVGDKGMDPLLSITNIHIVKDASGNTIGLEWSER